MLQTPTPAHMNSHGKGNTSLKVKSGCGHERPFFSMRRFTPVFAEAASRRQAEAFPRQRIIFVMTGMSLKGSTDRLSHLRMNRFFVPYLDIDNG
jgi:hypothetical protein